MSRLELTTFGVPHIKIDGRSNTALSARKAQALLIYLAVTSQQHSRQVLAGLLWGEMPEDKARRNLRVTLTRIRNPLKKHLHIRRRSLRLDDAADCWLDVAEFEACLNPISPSVAQLERAAALYRGHFLDDFVLRDAPLFEEWIRPLQERYRQMAMETMYRLATHYTAQKQYPTAIGYANRLLLLEPWMEEAHRQLMLLLALSGKRSAALNQYELCCDLLQEELGVAPAAATVALYRQILNEEIQPDTQPIAVAPPALASPVPNQVPAGISHFVGRATDVEALAKLLGAEAGPPLLALVGMGGVGKSSLAVQLAKMVQPAFPDGILWANAANSEPMSILENWALAYGYDFSRIGDLESMAAAFRRVLADKQALIVLDDVTSVSRIRPLLPNGAQCRVLLTTRNQELARALKAQVWLLRELDPENGRLLLSNILGQKRIAAEPDAVAEICTLLQNLPLALEITAQRLKSRPRRRLADIAERLRDETSRLSQLKLSDRAVRASFAVSWEALDAERRRVFALIGLFNGRSFTAEALAHIAQMDKYPLEDRLFDLANLSLLREEAERRYQQHPLLADFAREKLEEEMEGDAYGRFARYYLQFAQTNQTNYDTLRPEWDNLMAAMEAAHTHQLHKTVIQFADALNDAWFKSGRFTQARQGYAQAHTAALALADESHLATNLLRWSLACIEQNDYEEATKHLTQHLNHVNKTKNNQAIAIAKYHLGRISLEQYQFEEAEQLLEESLLLSRELNDQVTASGALYRKARIYYTHADLVRAKSLATRALQIQETTQGQQGIIPTLRLLAQIELANKQYDLALQHIQKAQKYGQQAQDQGEHVATLYVQLGIQRLQKNYEQSLQIAHEGIHLAKQLGLRMYEALFGFDTCLTHMDLHNHQQALTQWPQYSQLLQEVGNQLYYGLSKMYMGDAFNQLGQAKQAMTAWQDARQVAVSIKHMQLLTWVETRLENAP